MEDFEQCYRAVTSRDERFDGWFFTAVTSTGIYCRPSCPALTPKRSNVRFYPTAAAAQTAGLRACRRCRPDAVPGSPAWNNRADVVARAMRLINDGTVEREGVAGLARRLGYTERHLYRLLVAEVAFASGFASVRQFNDTVRDVFATTPTQLRRRAMSGTKPVPTGGALDLRLAHRAPFDGAALVRWLGRRAVPGVEEAGDGVYRRTLRLPHAAGMVELWPGAGHVRARLQLEDPRDLTAAVRRCRWLLDLDADPVAVDAVLSPDALLSAAVWRSPGRRVPHTVDGGELAVRAVLGQQVSLAGARTLAGRLVTRLGKPLTAARGALTHLFPEPEAVADADLRDIGIPGSRARALAGVTRALADGTLNLDAGAARGDATDVLTALPGIGPWTTGYIAMRALGDPDAFPDTDLGLRKAAAAACVEPKHLAAVAQRWRPWRSYAAEYLWSTLEEQ